MIFVIPGRVKSPMPPTETMWRDCANNICHLSSGESQMLFCILSQTGVSSFQGIPSNLKAILLSEERPLRRGPGNNSGCPAPAGCPVNRLWAALTEGRREERCASSEECPGGACTPDLLAASHLFPLPHSAPHTLSPRRESTAHILASRLRR